MVSTLIAHLLLMTTLQSTRVVPFQYVPGRVLNSVSVVGQFNDWDRAAFPLKLESDGKTWSGQFPIAPGVYQYLFVENGDRWIADPTAPPAPDANGNINSLLIVSPLEYDANPGSRGDGIVTASAIRHNPDRRDTVRLSGDRAAIKVRTRMNDVDGVDVVVGKKSYPGKAAGNDPLVETWRVEFNFPSGWDGQYRIFVKDGDKSFYLGPDGLSETPGKAFRQEIAKFPLPSEIPWVEDAVFYQIFPDRFANGDPSNDGPNVKAWDTQPTPETWRIRLGGDLAGIRKHLDHLSELGVNAIYLNPIFDSLSNHGYDTNDYLKVDLRFGSNEDLKNLVKEAHRRHIRVILDAVFNHSSPEFFAFQDLREKGEASAYKDWYFPLTYPISTAEGQQTYRTFAGVPTMPKLNQDNPATRDYFTKVGVHWIQDAGIDGWRLDVADAVSQDFWRHFRTAIKGAKKDAYIVGEAWGDAHEYLQGDQHDAVMNYRWRKAILDFLAERALTPRDFAHTLDLIRGDYPDAVQNQMFNLLGSHDTWRLRTSMKGDIPRERLAVLLQFTLPGTPSIYYGDEIGMEGGREPLSRGPMVWDRDKWDTRTFAFYQALIKLRKDHPCLRRGDFRLLRTDATDGIFAFERRSGKSRVQVVLNTSDHEVVYFVPEDLWKGAKSNITMAPLSFAVLTPDGLVNMPSQ